MPKSQPIYICSSAAWARDITVALRLQEDAIPTVERIVARIMVTARLDEALHAQRVAVRLQDAPAEMIGELEARVRILLADANPRPARGTETMLLAPPPRKRALTSGKRMSTKRAAVRS